MTILHKSETTKQFLKLFVLLLVLVCSLGILIEYKELVVDKNQRFLLYKICNEEGKIKPSICNEIIHNTTDIVFASLLNAYKNRLYVLLNFFYEGLIGNYLTLLFILIIVIFVVNNVFVHFTEVKKTERIIKGVLEAKKDTEFISDVSNIMNQRKFLNPHFPIKGRIEEIMEQVD